MSILVTGGSGFIGSHLVDRLLAETDQSVHILDDFSTGNRTNLDHITDDRLTIEQGDVRDAETVESAVVNSETVYHLAAAVGVQNVVKNPLESLQTNLQGTENVLEAAAEHQKSTFIASTSEVYGKSESLPFAEDDDRVLGPISIPRWGYASAKAVDEFLAYAYHDEYNFPVVVGRYFNIVGPRQVSEYGMVIPTLVEQALAGEPLTVYGDGTQKRSFIHVADAVQATHELLTTEAAHGEVFNIGTPSQISINHLAERVLELTESDSEITHIPFEKAYDEDFEEPDSREPDVTKLGETLGWAPEIELDRILKDVIAERRKTMEVSND